MNILKFLSPKYLSYILSQFKEMRIRSKRTEVQIEQVYSLLQLKDLVSAIPPAHLQIRVSGSYYGDFFLHGQFLLNKLNDGLASVGVKQTLAEFDNVLDFGCGCGRLLIPLTLRSANPKGIHGVDIDPEPITWLAEHYPQIGSVKVNPDWPPMLHPDETFDVVYAVSVFTHLPEDLEHAWLADISRVVRKGGYALLTVQGEAFYDLLTPSGLQKVQEEGFHYTNESSLTDGLPQYYKVSYHTKSYIQERWKQYFDVLNVIPMALDKQDLVVLQKR